MATWVAPAAQLAVTGIGAYLNSQGKGDTTTSGNVNQFPVIPDDVLNLYRHKTGIAQAGVPQFADLLSAGLSGDASKVLPYVRNAYAPQAQATQTAIDQMRRTIPRGGAQDLAVANALQQGAMQKGQMSGALLARLLDYYSTIFGGYSPEKSIGQSGMQTVSQHEPFMLKLGSFGSIPIG